MSCHFTICHSERSEESVQCKLLYRFFSSPRMTHFVLGLCFQVPQHNNPLFRAVFYAFPLHRCTNRMIHQALCEWAGELVKLINRFVYRVFVAAC